MEVRHDALDLTGRGSEVRDGDRREILEAAARELDGLYALHLGPLRQGRDQPADARAQLHHHAPRHDSGAAQKALEELWEPLGVDEPRDVLQRFRIGLHLLAEGQLLEIYRFGERGSVPQRAFGRRQAHLGRSRRAHHVRGWKRSAS